MEGLFVGIFVGASDGFILGNIVGAEEVGGTVGVDEED